MSESRDITSGSDATVAAGAAGRNVIAVISIDRYHHWRRLGNAVNDAMGAAAVFQRLRFEQVTAPLVDDAATGKAIQSLVTDDLKMLGPEDSLVLFYAGHGGTRRHSLGDKVVKTGYLIPVDASDSPDRVSTWVDLEGWLRTVSLLPARHILVVLDACHSGIALDPAISGAAIRLASEPAYVVRHRRDYPRRGTLFSYVIHDRAFGIAAMIALALTIVQCSDEGESRRARRRIAVGIIERPSPTATTGSARKAGRSVWHRLLRGAR